MNICVAAADLLWSRVFRNYPALKVALSEGGTGWIPYFLDRLDRVYDRHHVWTGQDFDGLKPSQVFKKHFITCFITDPVGIQHRHDIGSRTSVGSSTILTPTPNGPAPRRSSSKPASSSTCRTTRSMPFRMRMPCVSITSTLQHSAEVPEYGGGSSL